MPYDRIIYFGDSLTDSDEFYNLSSQLLVFPLPSAVFGYAGQFSNGPVYADIAPTVLGIGADESLNYAVGGARAVGLFNMGGFLASSPLAVPNPDPALLDFDSNLGGQIERFLADRPALGDLSGAAASFLIGLNDFNTLAQGLDPATFDPVEFGARAGQLATDILTATLGAATQAALAGVGTIVLNTLPVGGFFPLTQAVPEFAQPLANDLVRQYNDALIAQSAALEQLGVNVVIVDFEALASEIMANGSNYGFLNTTDALWIGTGADPQLIDPDGDGPLPALPGFEMNPALAALDPDQFAFFDLLHPTTAAHGLFGAFQAATLAGDNIEFLGDGRNFDRGTADNDLIFAQGGNDFVLSGNGEDVLFGGAGRDFLRGGNDNDIMAGGDGNDLAYGGADADVVVGNAGRDLLFGGHGDDAIVDGLGSDRAFGGSGDDTFFYAEAGLIGGTNGTDRDVFVGGAGEDTLYLAVTDDSRAGVEAAIDSASGFFARFADLGLITIGIENFVLLDSRAEFDAVTVSAELQPTLDEAEFWNLV